MLKYLIFTTFSAHTKKAGQQARARRGVWPYIICTIHIEQSQTYPHHLWRLYSSLFQHTETHRNRSFITKHQTRNTTGPQTKKTIMYPVVIAMEHDQIIFHRYVIYIHGIQWVIFHDRTKLPEGLTWYFQNPIWIIYTVYIRIIQIIV